MSFKRIAISESQMGGVACLRALRIPVATVVGMVADGMSDAEILDAFPDLQVEDIREALAFAAEAVRERELPLLTRRSMCPKQIQKARVRASVAPPDRLHVATGADSSTSSLG